MKKIRCLYCNKITFVQELSPGTTIICEHCHTTLAAIAPNAAFDDNPLCPVCCSPISDGDISVVCSLCNTEYHEECWQENKGCATYGCANTGCLAPQASTKPTYGEVPISTPPPLLPGGDYNTIPQPSGMIPERDNSLIINQLSQTINDSAVQEHVKVSGLAAAFCCALSFIVLFLLWIIGYFLKWLGEMLFWIGSVFISIKVNGACFILGTIIVIVAGSIYAFRNPDKITEWGRILANKA